MKKSILLWKSADQWRSQPKNWVFKMFGFRQITLFCLEKLLSKHKMTICSKNLGEGMAPLAPLATTMLQIAYYENYRNITGYGCQRARFYGYCRNIGQCLWCSRVGRLKRFVNVHSRCIVSNLTRISKMLTLPPLEKFLRTPIVTMTVYFPVWHCTSARFTVPVSCDDEIAVRSCPVLCL